jgi:cysteine desulfurase
MTFQNKLILYVMLKFPIYLDHNATTPCDPRVVEAMMPYFTEYYGNAASRSHGFGWQAEEAVEFAREQVARLIGAEVREIIFTSGATEADNLAIKGVFDTYSVKGNHIITVTTEHKAVLDTCKRVEKEGGEITCLKVQPDGVINLDDLEAAIRPTTILIAVMYANNETGVIQPIKEISAIAKKHGIIFFVDAAQAVGKIAVDVKKDGIDLMSISAHKFYGPKGVGALYVRRRDPRVQLTAQMDGGGHERGIRSGTLNVPAIVGFGKACEIALQQMQGDASRVSVLRDELETALLKEDAQVNGNTKSRLPHVTNISFKNLEPGLLMGSVNKEIAVSSGSACTSASMEPSYVLKAMQVEDDLAFNSIRFSLGRNTTKEEITYTIEFIKEAINKLKKQSVLNYQ